MLRVELINTGTELLFGSVTNSLLPYLGQELFAIGLRIERQIAVPDGPAIAEALREAFARSEIVLVTGGLGPTSDDVTRDFAAELTGRPLEFHEAIFERIRERFARRKLTLSSSIARQAYVPKGAIVLPNDFGTAPGLYLPKTKTSPAIFLFPGPPRELRPMFETYARPILRDLVGQPALAAQLYRITGQGESNVEGAVGAALSAFDGLEVGYCARPGEVDLRLIGTRAVLDEADTIVRGRLGEYLVTTGTQEIENVIVQLLTDQNRTLAVAESCTGGLIADRLTNVPGSSKIFLEGTVPYSNEAKSRTLSVPAHLIDSAGAVSQEVAAAMAQGARQRAGSDYALATTGVAGPDGGTPEKPVGTVFVGLAQAGRETIVQKLFFPMDRISFKRIVSQCALDLLRRKLAENRRADEQMNRRAADNSGTR
jgi:nicotinamide-nucleotide amidase